jgi:hypothetical protein
VGKMALKKLKSILLQQLHIGTKNGGADNAKDKHWRKWEYGFFP